MNSANNIQGSMQSQQLQEQGDCDRLLTARDRIQWGNNAAHAQDFGQRMVKHYHAHSPDIIELEKKVMAIHNSAVTGENPESSKLQQQAMKDKVEILVEMLREKTNQRRAQGLAGGKISLESQIEVNIAGKNQNVSVTDTHQKGSRRHLQQFSKVQKQHHVMKHLRQDNSDIEVVRSKSGGYKTELAESLDMTRKRYGGSIKMDTCYQSNLDVSTQAAESMGGALLYTNVAHLTRGSRYNNPESVVTSQVGQPYKDLAFSNTDQPAREQQLYNSMGKLFAHRPLSQHSIKRVKPTYQRQIKSQLAFMQPVIRKRHRQNLIVRGGDMQNMDIQTDSADTGRLLEQKTETTENTMMFLAKSNRPQPNYALNYFQKRMKLNKNWEERPKTSNMLLGSSSLGENGNFVVGRTSAMMRKPATDFIVKNKESVATHNQPSYNLPIMTIAEAKRKSNHLPANLANKNITKVASTTDTAQILASRSRSPLVTEVEPITKQLSPVIGGEMGVNSRLNRVDFRIKKGDKKLRRKKSNNSQSRRNSATNILVSTATFKEGQNMRAASPNSMNERDKTSSRDRSYDKRNSPGRRSSSHSVFKRMQAAVASAVATTENAKSGPGKLKQRQTTAKGSNAYGPHTAQLPASIQQYKDSFYFSEQKQSQIPQISNDLCSRNCQQNSNSSQILNQAKFVDNLAHKVRNSRQNSSKKSDASFKILLFEEKRHMPIINKSKYREKKNITQQTLLSKKIETIVPPITDVQDLTDASHYAMHEKHGVTQYRHNDQSSSLHGSVYLNIDGVETNITRQRQIDDLNSNCHSQLLANRKRLNTAGIELGTIEGPAMTNRDCRGGSIDRSCSADRPITSRGYQCGQCTDCIHREHQGVQPSKVKIQLKVGNSNRQKLEVLKPKWVGGQELKNVPDDARMIFKLQGPELFEKQLPMLITANHLLIKRKYRPEMRPIEYEAITAEFVNQHVWTSELEHSVTLQEIEDIKIAAKLDQQAQIRALISQRARGDVEIQAGMLLEQVPLAMIILGDGETKQINEIKGMILEIVGDFAEDENQEPQAVEQHTKADQLWVFDPKYEEATIISNEWFRKMELTILVVYQFQSRIGSYLQKRARYHRQKKALFERTSEQEKHGDNFVDPSVQKTDQEILEFLDLDMITEPRTRENRAEIYKKASRAMPAIVEICREYDILTPQLEDTAYHSDYGAMERLNSAFEDAYDMVEPREGKLVSVTILKTNFADFFTRYQNDTDEVCKRIESETYDLVGHPYLGRVDPIFEPLFERCLAPERLQFEKYRSYAEHIFVEFAPRDPVDDLANQGYIEKHYMLPEARRTRKQLETEIYRGWAFPLASETLTFHFLPGVSNAIIQARMQELADFAEDLTTASGANLLKVGSEQVVIQGQDELEELSAAVELEQSQQISELQSPLAASQQEIAAAEVLPNMMYTGLMEAEALAQEYNRLDQTKHANVVQGYKHRLYPVEQEMSLSNLFAASVYRVEFALPLAVSDAFEEEKYCELASRSEIFVVYPLLANKKTPWFDKSRFYQQIMKNDYQTRLENRDMNEMDADTGTESDIKKQKKYYDKVQEQYRKQQKDHYREIIQKLYRKNLVLILECEKATVSTTIGLSEPNVTGKQTIKFAEKEEEDEEQKVQAELPQNMACLRQENDMDDEDDEMKLDNIDDYFSETEEDEEVEPKETKIMAKIDDYIVSNVIPDDDSSSDGENVRLPSVRIPKGLVKDLQYGRGASDKHKIHKALLPNKPKQDDRDNLSSEEEEYKLDELVELLAQEDAPASTVREVNENMLQHPDFEQLNSWMDVGTHDLCYSWDEQERQALQKPKFELNPKSRAASVSSVGHIGGAVNDETERSSQPTIVGHMLKFIQTQELQ